MTQKLASQNVYLNMWHSLNTSCDLKPNVVSLLFSLRYCILSIYSCLYSSLESGKRHGFSQVKLIIVYLRQVHKINDLEELFHVLEAIAWINLYSLPKRLNILKSVYNDHPRYPKFVAVVDRWLLFRGMIWKLKSEPRNSGRCRQVVVFLGVSNFSKIWKLEYSAFCLLQGLILKPKCKKCI